MKPATIVGLTAVAVGIIYFATKSKAAGFLNYYLKRISLKWAGQTPILVLDLAIQNPSNSSFLVKSIVGNLYSNGDRIGNVSAYGDVTIAAANESVYPLEIRMNLVAIVSDIVKIFTGGGIAQEIEFKGAINVDNHTMPLEFKYNIG